MILMLGLAQVSTAGKTVNCGGALSSTKVVDVSVPHPLGAIACTVKVHRDSW